MGEGKKGLGAGPSTLQAPGPAGERAPALLQAGFPQDTWHRSEGGCLGLLELLETHFWHPHNSSRLQEALAQQTRAANLQKKTRTTKARGRAQRRRMKMLGQTPLRHAGGRDRRQKQLWERKKKKQQPSLLLSFRGRIPIDMDAAARCPPPARLAGFSFSGHAAGEQREEGSSWPIRRVSCAVWLAESSLGAHLQPLHVPRARFWGIPTAHVVREPQNPAAPAGMQAGSSALQGCLRVLFRQGYTYHFLKAG